MRCLDKSSLLLRLHWPRAIAWLVVIVCSDSLLCAQSALVQTKTVIRPIDIYAINETATVASANGVHVAFSISQDDDSRIILDGMLLPNVGRGAKRNLIFSPDGKHLAYIFYKDPNGVFLANGKVRRPDAVTQQGPYTASFVVDGKVGPEFDEIEPSSIAFSPDGSHIVYAARKEKEWSVMIDGKPSPAYDGLEAIELDRYRDNNSWISAMDASSALEFAPVFTADSKHVAYMAKINAPLGNRSQNAFGPAYTYRIVVDGVPGPAYNTIFRLYESIDGLHFGYVGMSYGTNQRFSQMVIDGVPGPKISRSSDETFSPDMQHAAYAIPGTSSFLIQVVLDGVAGPMFDQVIDQSLHFSRDGKHFAYLASTFSGPAGRETQFVLDGVPRPVSEGMLFPVFSADGQHSANVAQSGELLQLIKDGKPYLAPYSSDNANIILSPDGKRLVYVEKQGTGECVTVDGVAGPPFDNINPFKIIFSADSQHIAYLNQKENKWQVVVDGVAGPEFDEIADGSLQFTSDSSHTVYTARNAERWQVVVDSQPGPVFDEIQNKMAVLSTDGHHISYVGFNNRKPQVWVDGQLSPVYDEVTTTGQLTAPALKALGVGVSNRTPGPLTPPASGLVISHAAGNLAYAARSGNKVQVVVNGVPGPVFEGIFGGPTICNNGLLEYLALEKIGGIEGLVRVDVSGFDSVKP